MATETQPPYHVLILCTGNSARSILAEAVLNDPAITHGRFIGHSAGSRPRGEVHPQALKTLQAAGYPIEGLRSKSWDEFGAASAPHMDFIFTVCDSAAGETCPYWPGHPATAHWGMPDPAAVPDSDPQGQQAAFEDTLRVLRHRIRLLVELPLANLDAHTLQAQLKAIGHAHP